MMDFLNTVEYNFKKLNDISVVTKLWNEIISGKSCEIPAEKIIEYTFHYPVDTDLYLEELNLTFDDSLREELRTINGDLKAYLLTFLYYCMKSFERLPLKTSLLAAKLYLKIIMLPSGLGNIYFENSIYMQALVVCLVAVKNESLEYSYLLDVLTFIRDYALQHHQQLQLPLIKSTADTFAFMIILTDDDGSTERDDTISTFSTDSLKELISYTEHPDKLRKIMICLLIPLRSKPFEKLQDGKRETASKKFRNFITEVLAKTLDEDKLQYLIDAFFTVWGKDDFDSIEGSVQIINCLDNVYYKEILRKMPNYLISKNHKGHHLNIMKMVHAMTLNLPAHTPDKFEVFFSCCLKNIFMQILSKTRAVQDKAIETLANIFSMEENLMVKKIFEIYESTGLLSTMHQEAILVAFSSILEVRSAISSARNKNILVIITKVLIHTDCISWETTVRCVNLICKDLPPYAIKPMLPHLHKLYIYMYLKNETLVCREILQILFNNAVHHDGNSKVFLEHLFNSLVNHSHLDGKQFPPEFYSNLFLDENFEYKIIFAKCSKTITYQHVHKTVLNLDHRQKGHAMLLNCLLEYIKYNETDHLTDYMIDNFPDIAPVENVGVLFNAYLTILRNKGRYASIEYPKFDILHGLLWDGLYQQNFVVSNIKNVFDLIAELRDILKLGPDDEMKQSLMMKTSELAYFTLHKRDISPSVLYLTEICLMLRKMPDPRVHESLEAIIKSPESMNLLTSQYKNHLVQIMAYFATVATMKREKLPLVLDFLKEVLYKKCPVLQVSALKLMYSLCSQLTHEYEEIIEFVLQEITNRDACISRICIVIMEELIHDNYIMLNAEDFLKIVYRLGTDNMHIFTRHVLDKRFMLSNKNDIGRYYISTLVCISGYSKFHNYQESSNFAPHGKKIRLLVTSPNDIFNYLFKAIPIRTKFNILKELVNIIDQFMGGQFRVDECFFEFLLYGLYTFKIMASKEDAVPNRVFYNNVCKCVEKQILAKDSRFKENSFYGEHEADVRKCTKTLLKFLFYVENDMRLTFRFRFPVFDTLMIWIDHVKAEIVQYVHYEKGSDYDPYFSKLMAFYRINKETLGNLADIQDSSSFY